MEEEKPKEEIKEDTIVDEANQAAQRIELANKETRELVERQEALAAHKALAGKSEAGEEPEKPKEESDADYAKRILEHGTP